MTVQDGDEFIIVDIAETLADMDFTQKSKVCHQLTEPYLRCQGPDFGQHFQCLAL